MLTCRELFDFLLAYVEGELPPDEAARFKEHLSVCSDCVSYMDTYKKTAELAAEACHADDEVPPDVPEALVRAILDAQRRDT